MVVDVTRDADNLVGRLAGVVRICDRNLMTDRVSLLKVELREGFIDDGNAGGR